MLQILNNLSEFFKLFEKINKFTNNNFKIVIYSENKTYQKYSKILIDNLIEKFPNQILYATSDKDDFINDTNIKNLYIGKSYSLQYFFTKIKSENLITTTIDLGNNLLKKKNNIKNYIYFFHSPVSTTKVYTSAAFDNYDTILCIGDFQKNEIQKRENIKGINTKKLIECGYFYFDYLKNKHKDNNINDEILIAPSWNYNEKNFINEDFDQVIESLLRNKNLVKFRPHPEHFKRSKNFINYLEKKYLSENFILDDEIENYNSMQKAKCLITDNSGIAIEYTLIFKRPVFYYKSLDKIHNKEIENYKNLYNIEDHLKKLFGYTFNKDQIENLDTFIDKNITDFNQNHFSKINQFMNDNFYNFSKTKEFLNNNIKEILY